MKRYRRYFVIRSWSDNYQVVVAVISYGLLSISSVYINDWLLSDSLQEKIPIFILCIQLVIGTTLIGVINIIRSWKKRHEPATRRYSINARTALAVLPMSLSYCGTLFFTNFLKTFAQPALQNVYTQGLSCVLTVCLSYFIIGAQPGVSRHLISAISITSGYLMCAWGSNDLGVTVQIVVFGVLSAICMSLCAVSTKISLDSLQQRAWLLILYNNVNSLALAVCACVVLEVKNIVMFMKFDDADTWLSLCASSLLTSTGHFLTLWLLQLTSPHALVVSANMTAAVHTLLLTTSRLHTRTAMWWIGNLFILAGGGYYVRSKMRQIRRTSHIAPSSIVTNNHHLGLKQVHTV